jgi:hypothetical protein
MAVLRTVLASANGGTFVSRRIVEWIPADAPVGVAPRKLPEPEPRLKKRDLCGNGLDPVIVPGTASGERRNIPLL